MTRQEFIRKLQEALNGKLDAATIQDHLKFYDDYIIEEMRKGKRASRRSWNCSEIRGQLRKPL